MLLDDNPYCQDRCVISSLRSTCVIRRFFVAPEVLPTRRSVPFFLLSGGVRGGGMLLESGLRLWFMLLEEGTQPTANTRETTQKVLDLNTYVHFEGLQYFGFYHEVSSLDILVSPDLLSIDLCRSSLSGLLQLSPNLTNRHLINRRWTMHIR